MTNSVFYDMGKFIFRSAISCSLETGVFLRRVVSRDIRFALFFLCLDSRLVEQLPEIWSAAEDCYLL